MSNFTWIANITYRSKNGDIVVDHHVEELYEIHDIVERCPDWNTIVEIKIWPNEKRTSFPNDTIEDAQLR